CGADLWILDTAAGESRKIEIDFPSPRVQQQRKFVPAARHLEDYQLHPQGHSIATVVRGKVFAMGLWEGPASSIGDADGVRKRLARWLPDGKRLVFVSDAGGEERLELHSLDPLVDPVRFDEFDVGRAIDIEVAPKEDAIILSNHRLELIYIHLGKREMRVLDKSPIERISGMTWSPDGRWIAYGFRAEQSSTAIKLCRIETGETHLLTQPVLYDVSPRFDPDGKYLFFLSYRQFDPVYDNMQFDLGFPRGVRPMMVTLRKDHPSPLTAIPRAPGDKPKYDLPPSPGAEKATPKPEANDAKPGGETKPAGDAKAATPAEPDASAFTQIDLEGIGDRIQSLPVPDARYVQIEAIRGKVLFMAVPIEGRLSAGGSNSATGVLESFNLEELEKETLATNVTDFMVSANHKIMAIRSGQRLRVLKAGEKPDDTKGSDASRKSGWLDLRRLRVSIMPAIERAQMFREAWRLQRDHFWAADMSGMDWEAVYRRYEPLVARVSTRSEFSDLLWELHGELGTSHAYEMGGDYRPEPRYDQGFLGADLTYDPAASGWRIARILHGDSWDRGRGSPLLEPGLNVRVGDLLIAVNGRRLSREVSPAVCLVHQADAEVTLTFLIEEAPAIPPALDATPPASDAPTPAEAVKSIDEPAPNEALSSENVSSGEATAAASPAADASAPAAVPAAPAKPKTRTLTVRTLRDDRAARYRDWVEENRRIVHERSNGRVGYIHVPDMGPRGFAEFHRYYLAEFDRPALLVDVRCNGGGHVSGLLLEKLSRRRIGWCNPRWGRPRPYPDSAPAGPMLALTNEVAGSDGDIFSHSFQMMKLGPLVGTRTWGGVVGIWVRHSLVDGTVTTQPEFSYWFAHQGWGVENHGATPDVEIEIAPHDVQAGRDPQLEESIKMLLGMLDDAPRTPAFEAPPSRALPTLPPRAPR
ncbi:MAG TPA: S41 family peptidase, partial [Pirellulales bacterium]